MKILLSGSSGICAKYLLPFLMDNPDIKEIVGVSRYARHYYGNHPDRVKEKYVEAESQLDKKNYAFRLISELKPTHILNFAGISTSYSPALDIWDTNTKITLNLLESCKSLNHPVRFLQASSIAVENIPISIYSASKLACENIVESYNQLYPELIEGINVRFCAVVGKNNKHGLLMDLVNKLKSDSEKLVLWGERPGSRKPFIYAKNLAEILNNLMFAEDKFWHWGRFKICPTDSLTVEQVAGIAMDYLSIKKEIEWVESKVWRGDQSIVFPSQKGNYFDKMVLSSKAAIRAAIGDILNEQN